MTRQAGHGGFGRGSQWSDLAWQARYCRVRRGVAWPGLAGSVWLVAAWFCEFGCGMAVVVRCGKSGSGAALYGDARQAWPGFLWLGAAWFVVARQARYVKVRQVKVRRGTAWQAWNIKHADSSHTKESTMSTTTETPSLNGSTPDAPAQVTIRRIEAQTMIVPIVGLSPLIVHRFSEKAKRIMLETMQGKSAPKEAKNPSAEYEAAFHRFKDGGFGFPCIGFKASTIGGCRFYGKAVTMTAVKQFLFIRGEIGLDGQQLARIDGEPRMREDVVRVGRGGADLRYRPEFPEWSTELEITYVTGSIDKESVLSLINAGGMGVGVGEWRPEKNGDMGQFEVDTTRQVRMVS